MYATESLVPQLGAAGSKTIAEMRKELISDNFDSARELSIDEVEDAYEMIKYLSQYREQAADVPYPLYSTSEMEGNVSTKWDELIEINFKEGGSFLAEPDLKAKYIPGVLDLFASLVRFDSGKKTEWMKDAAVYDALPSLFIKFASGSRVDSGHRLLMRCVRHAFDSRAPSLDNQSASLILHEGSVGIQLNAAIPASMKKQVYECGVVATAKDILCCQCGCQCGSKGKEKQVCVHILPLLFLLTILLFEDLAEHMLLELAACMSSDIWDKSIWSDDDIEWMKRSIITLAEAAGEPVDTHKQTDDIEDLLEKFVVGTQRRKTWKQRIKTPPKPSELGPVHKMKMESTAKLASSAVKRCTDMSEQILVEQSDSDDNDQDMEDTVDLFTPDYGRVWSLMEAADCCEGMLEEGFAGIKLLSMRSDKDQSRDKLEQTKLNKQARKDWKELKRLAKKRSIRNIEQKIKNLPSSSSSEQQSDSESPTKKTKTDHAVTPSPPKPLPQNTTYIKPSMWCGCNGCNNNNVNSPNVKFHSVPSYPKELKPDPKRKSVINRGGKILLRQEVMDRIGESRYDKKKKKYICEHHMFETVIKRKLITYKGKRFSQRYELTVPCSAGAKSSLTPSDVPSKGNAYERAMTRLLAEADDTVVPQSLQEEELDKLLQQLKDEAEGITSTAEKNRNLEEQTLVLEAKVELAKSDTTLASKAIQQMAEETCKDTHIPINTSVRLAAGMGTTKGNASSVVKQDRPFFHSDPIKQGSNKRNLAADCDPQVHLGMSDSEVKRRTGFPSLVALLSYIFVVCDGDIDIIKKRQTSLTWYEEWFLHFEYIWGKSLTRIVDVEKTFGIDDFLVRRVIDAKYDIEWRALLSWPLYPTYEEDMEMRSETFKRKYEGKRVIMHDMTNIHAYAFTDADLQRLTWNDYYGENCFKGGVYSTTGGFHGTYTLWPGAVSDSDYNRRAGYLDEQREFQTNDTVDGEVKPFMNIYDKGYRAKMAAYKAGKQEVLQPDWAESDRRFNRTETLGSASVASDRGGNERSVNVSKRAGYISRGFQPNMCPVRMNKAWRTWGFQTNFMFKPVL